MLRKKINKTHFAQLTFTKAKELKIKEKKGGCYIRN
jgi:hypothetical protein